MGNSVIITTNSSQKIVAFESSGINLAKINDVLRKSFKQTVYFYAWDQIFEHKCNQESSVETKKSIVVKYGSGVEALSACKHVKESLNRYIQLLLILLSNG